MVTSPAVVVLHVWLGSNVTPNTSVAWVAVVLPAVLVGGVKSVDFEQAVRSSKLLMAKVITLFIFLTIFYNINILNILYCAKLYKIIVICTHVRECF
jgi:hypothetical protein